MHRRDLAPLALRWARTGLRVSVLLAVGLIAMPTLARQPKDDATGTLDGRLTDNRSVPLVEAAILVRNLATGVTVRAVTGKNASFHFTGLGPGEYRLEAEIPNLGNGSVDGIFVSPGHTTRMQAALLLQLPLSRQSEELPTLHTDSQGLDPVQPAVSTEMGGEELAAVPLVSRDWAAFESLSPGAAPNAASRGANAEDPAGGDLDDDSAVESMSFRTTATIDGSEHAADFETPRTSSRSVSNAPGISAVDSIESLRGLSAAEEASSGGAAIKMTTAHGSNGLHGQAFYLNRQSLWGALNPFTQWVKETAPVNGDETAQFAAESYSPGNSQQTLGVGAGSQLKRNKLYWFAALDGLLRNDPAVATARHPADFFAQPTEDELTMLAARLDLSAAAPVEEAARSYSKDLERMDTLLGPVPRSSRQWQEFARMDWQMSERQHLSVEGNYADLKAPGGARGRSSETYGSHSFGDSYATDLWSMGRWDDFLTANLLGSIAGQYRRHVQSNRPQTPSAFEEPLLANAWGELPEMVADSRNGFILGKPANLGKSSDPDERSVVAQATLSWVKGNHLLKFGAGYDHIADFVDTLANQTGTYSYADLLNFVSDVASFEQYGFNGVDNPYANQHNCDPTGKVHTSAGELLGLGYLPCYAWYTQRVGPSNWHLSTNDLSAYASEQWQPSHQLTLSAGVRVEKEQLPGTIGGVANPFLPATLKLPSTGLSWAPRIGLAWSPVSRTVLRVGAGIYYGRIGNAVVLTALTQTGSPYGDLNLFFKPADAGAPPFPFVFSATPETVVTPGAVAFASRFRVPEIDQAVVSLEQQLPGHWLIAASVLASLGRRLPVSLDTNLAAPAQPASGAPYSPPTITYAVIDSLGKGPVKAAQITVPFYTERTNADYQQIDSIESRANSTYDAAMFKITRTGHRGLTLRAHYLYAHATDWNPDEWANATNSVLDPADFHSEYGTSNLDMRHSAAATVLYQAPWKLRHWEGQLANAWAVAAVGQFRSGLPYTMRTGGYIPGFLDSTARLIEGVATGMNGSGGDNRVYGKGSDGKSYSIGRNTYRYPATWTGDSRLSKRFNFPHQRELEFLAESFNLFNHQNVTRIETTGYTIDRGTSEGGLPTLNFLTGLTKAGLPSTTPEFGKPLDVNATNFYRPREFQFGLRARF